MNKKQKVFVTVISAIMISLLSLPVYAQTQEVVKAGVDRDEVTSNEFITLSVTINTGIGSASMVP